MQTSVRYLTKGKTEVRAIQCVGSLRMSATASSLHGSGRGDDAHDLPYTHELTMNTARSSATSSAEARGTGKVPKPASVRIVGLCMGNAAFKFDIVADQKSESALDEEAWIYGVHADAQLVARQRAARSSDGDGTVGALFVTGTTIDCKGRAEFRLGAALCPSLSE